MRESLFRAAQECAIFICEESVGQAQSESISTQVYESSFTPFRTNPKPLNLDSPLMIVWPYPRNTADCIDRASCADEFLRFNSQFKVITEWTLRNLPKDAPLPPEELILFIPFETFISDCFVGNDLYLRFRNRRCDVVASEMTIGYLQRHGMISKDNFNYTHLQTQFVNSPNISLSKAHQMDFFDSLSTELLAYGARIPCYRKVDNPNQLHQSLIDLFHDTDTIVIKPYAASQGTGVCFLDKNTVSTENNSASSILRTLTESIEKKYGHGTPFPLAICGFEEATKINGCVCDIRMFVINDHEAGALHAIPGMVRRAQVPFLARSGACADNALTNLNAAPAKDCIPGARIFAATKLDVLNQIGLSKEKLMMLGELSCLLCSKSLKRFSSDFDVTENTNYAYGSVDFVISAKDGLAVPIEINGANVGSHPTVHPKFSRKFAESMKQSLSNLNIE